jgi:exodeoxyribonuclease VII small subunit
MEFTPSVLTVCARDFPRQTIKKRKELLLKNFEERLEHLEKLGERVLRSDVPLNEALAAFEEGIKLARTREKDLEKIESRIEILVNGDATDNAEKPELELFNGV